MSQPTHVKSEFRGTEAECLQQAAVDAGRAAQNGYVPVSQSWSGVDDPRELTVIYEFRGAPATRYWTLPDETAASPAPGWLYVGFWRCFAAFLIDGFLLTIAWYALFLVALVGPLSSLGLDHLSRADFTIDPVTGRILAISPQAQSAITQLLGLTAAAFIVFFLVDVLYHTLLWWRFGATIGQKALGIEIRREANGSGLGVGRAIMRYVGYLVSLLVFCLGLIWVGIDSRKQGWHDKMAGTVGVRRSD